VVSQSPSGSRSKTNRWSSYLWLRSCLLHFRRWKCSQIDCIDVTWRRLGFSTSHPLSGPPSCHLISADKQSFMTMFSGNNVGTVTSGVRPATQNTLFTIFLPGLIGMCSLLRAERCYFPGHILKCNDDDDDDDAGSEMDTAVICSAAVGPGVVETGSFRSASAGSGGGGGVGGANPASLLVTTEPPSTHESCLPHFRDDCNRHLLFGCLSAAAGTLCNAFVLVQVSRFQQIIGVYTLQAPTEVAKVSTDLNLKRPFKTR